MSLVQNIKVASLEARKSRDKQKTDLLVTLLSDIQMIGKNDGNREPTDGDAIATIKKYLKNTDEVLAAYNGQALTQSTTEVVHQYEKDKVLLESFLPKQLSEPELKATINEIVAELGATSMKDMGKVMKVLKERHGGLYDGGEASKLVKASLA